MPILATAALVACASDEPTSSIAPHDGPTSFLTTPGWPGDVFEGCGISYPVVGGPCESTIGVSATVSPGIHLDSILIAAGYGSQLGSVPVRRYQHYQQGTVAIPPSPPLTITFSAPVRALLVQVIPFVSNRQARVTLRLTEADGRTETKELTRNCGFVSDCRFRPAYASDVGFVAVEISVPEGDHFGASLTIGGRVSQSHGVDLALSAPTGMTMPSELPSGSDACSIQGVTRERSYGLLARNATTGEPMPNLPVTLRLGAIEGSGGHREHVGLRPAGSFSPSAIATTAEVITDAEGRARFAYYAPEYSGSAFVSASAAGAVERADTFTVGVALARMTPGRWRYDGAPGARHDDVWYAAPSMVAAANALADSVHARWGQSLGFGDMSLPLGGRFDAAGDWTDPQHCSHRWGNALDLRHDDLTAGQKNFVSLRWRHLTGRAPVEHSGRFHLQTWREL